jgi:hypothetical protein
MLDPTRVEMLFQAGDGKMTGRCPACAEEGGDRKGEHLVIYPDGKFGCVLYPGEDGHEHRQRIWELAGMKDAQRSRRKPTKPRPVRIKTVNGTRGTGLCNS